jgi:hypothetical protein
MSGHAKLVRELVLEHVPIKRRHAATGRRIFNEVDAVYGSLSERRFWRVLKRLIVAGVVIRVGRINVNSEYYRGE